MTEPIIRFRDRFEAGRMLAADLTAYKNRSDAIVLGLPRGGVEVAGEIAVALNLPLDVLVVRKLGTPGHKELAMGAVASGGIEVRNDEILRFAGISEEEFDAAARIELQEVEGRARLYRAERTPLQLRDKIAILVDDGLATGATMKAAIAAVRAQHAAAVVVAVPVGAADVCQEIRPLVDELICLSVPPYFFAVGGWYHVFDQTSDAEVRSILDRVSGLARGLIPGGP